MRKLLDGTEHLLKGSTVWQIVTSLVKGYVSLSGRRWKHINDSSAAPLVMTPNMYSNSFAIYSSNILLKQNKITINQSEESE